MPLLFATRSVLAVLAVAAVASPALAVASSSFLLTKLDATIPQAQGGRCMDGTMAGFYVRKGTDNGATFTIFLQGGGACSDQASCAKRAKTGLGSSKGLQPTELPKPIGAGQAPTLDADCTANPDFCTATAVYVPYCSSDGWGGNRTTADDTSWGFYFSGHANLERIFDALVASHGLGGTANTRVLLTGQSAGGVGTFRNVDLLQQRLGAAVSVKAAPNAGWFEPAALPGDLPPPLPPSDYPHFANGTHGNTGADATAAEFVYDTLYQGKGVLNQPCIAAQPAGQWWACASIHNAYKYIAAPLFVVENMFDHYQIYNTMGAPENPSADQMPVLERYVAMFGEAMRNSTAQVLHDAPLAPKAHKDGLFLPSCLDHIVNSHMTIAGGSVQYNWLAVLGDWFFERGTMTEGYRLVERCPSEQPCHPGCTLPAPSPGPSPGPTPPGPGGACEVALEKNGCLPASKPSECKSCAEAHKVALLLHCTPAEAEKLCNSCNSRSRRSH